MELIRVAMILGYAVAGGMIGYQVVNCIIIEKRIKEQRKILKKINEELNL